MNYLSKMQIFEEFDKQTQNLISKNYPKHIGISEVTFYNLLMPLREQIANFLLQSVDIENGFLPFVIVVNQSLINPEIAMNMVEKNNINGVTILRPHTSENFKIIDGLELPSSKIYLLLNIDRGKDTINLPPNEALKIIKSKARYPITINEGIAIVTHFPEFLIKNNCFSLLGSRTGKDQRVPAIWINSKKEPNLGWCWDGNPHTWLGSASVKNRA